MFNHVAPKFKIGDRVVSKKTGCPMVGTVKSIIDPQFYLEISGNISVVYNTFAQYFPNWMDKAVYMVKFDSPQRSVSFQEFREGVYQNFFGAPYQAITGFEKSLPEVDERLLLASYNQVPVTQQAVYAEDDLEPL